MSDAEITCFGDFLPFGAAIFDAVPSVHVLRLPWRIGTRCEEKLIRRRPYRSRHARAFLHLADNRGARGCR